MSSASLGAWGEARAREHLIAQGFTLHASNWRCREGISQMDVTAGVITATVQNIDATVDTRQLVMTPSSSTDGSITWNWSGANGMPPAYVPKR